MRTYYFRLGNDVIGPMSLDDLRQFVSAGKVQLDTPVGFGPNGEWCPAAQVEGLCTPVSPSHIRAMRVCHIARCRPVEPMLDRAGAEQ